MLFIEIIAVFSQIHSKNTNTLCGQNLLTVKLVVHIMTLNFRGLNICYKEQSVNVV